MIPVIAAIHLLVLLLVILQRSAEPAPRDRGSPISVFDVDTPSTEPVPPQPEPEPPAPVLPIVVPIPEIPIELAETAPPAAPVFSPEAAARAGFGIDCDIAEQLARGIRGNPLLQDALKAIVPKSRSVANAVMLWDGAWVDFATLGVPEAIEPLRRAIGEAIRAAPAECLSQDVVGPRLVIISGGPVTTTLVLGSGIWRWERLLADVRQEPDAFVLKSSISERPR